MLLHVHGSYILVSRPWMDDSLSYSQQEIRIHNMILIHTLAYPKLHSMIEVLSLHNSLLYNVLLLNQLLSSSLTTQDRVVAYYKIMYIMLPLNTKKFSSPLRSCRRVKSTQ